MPRVWGAAIAAIQQGGRVAYPNGVFPEPEGGPSVEAVGYSGTPDRQTFDLLNALNGVLDFAELGWRREPAGVYPANMSDGEWAFVAPHLCLMKEDAPQRELSLRTVFDALRHIVRAGCHWRLLPDDLSQWQLVHQQATRWLAAGVFGGDDQVTCE